jgi:hypothetical protein
MGTPPEDYGPKETERRREAAIKKMLETPPKPHAAKEKKGASRAKSKGKKAK